MANISLFSAPVQAGKKLGKLLSIVALAACLLACLPTITGMFKVDTDAIVDTGDEWGNSIAAAVNRSRIRHLKREIARREALLTAAEASGRAAVLRMPTGTREASRELSEGSLKRQHADIAHLRQELINACQTQDTYLKRKWARQQLAQTDRDRQIVDELLEVRATAGADEKAAEDAEVAAEAEAAVNELFDLFAAKAEKLADLKAKFTPKSRITADAVKRGRAKLAALSEADGFEIEVKPGSQSTTFDVYVNGQKLTEVEQQDGRWLFKPWF